MKTAFFLGYTGMNNAGSDARIEMIVDDFRAVAGPDFQIVVGSFHPENTRKRVRRDDIAIEPLSFWSPFCLWRLCGKSDVTVIVEGSAFQQNWSSALLYLFVAGSRFTQMRKGRTAAYAVDAGKLTPFNARLVRAVCDRMDLIVLRSEDALRALRGAGVKAPIEVTTDPAFAFSAPAVKTERPTLALAPIEFYEWPVRMQLWGRRERCYRWPYYHSWNAERERKSDQMADGLAALATHAVREHDMDLTLVAMESLDGRYCRKVQARLPDDVRARTTLVSSETETPEKITSTLRGASCLVTCRYHACVLSMESTRPQMAICHDHRLRAIFGEIGLAEKFLIEHDAPDLIARLIPTFERMRAEGDEVSAQLQSRLNEHFKPLCARNRDALAEKMDRWIDDGRSAERKEAYV